MQEHFNALLSLALDIGATKANIIPVKNIELDAAFRDMCASNACGLYGKCWMCPPDVGDIHQLMATFKTYEYALVYQTVDPLEDSYDFEGMIKARSNFQTIACRLKNQTQSADLKAQLHLAAGGCMVCETCSKIDNVPCRCPQLALSSLEAYGVNVSHLASAAGMNYTNGANTVTYFGAVLFNLAGPR